MDPSLLVVTRIPIDELWNSQGRLAADKRRTLGDRDIASLLRHGPVRFVLAAIGEPLRWIPPPECYDFWKSEVKPRLVDDATFDQAAFPGSYCYVASEWSDGQPTPIVLVETYH